MTNIDKKVFNIKKFRNILIPRLDTFGDIVLLQGFIQALLDFLPDARITILVRKGYEQLASLFPTRLIWKTTQINPYKEPTDIEELKSLIYELTSGSYDLLLTTIYNRTWSDELIAALLISSHRVALGEAQELSKFLQEILTDLGIDLPEHLYHEYITVDEKIPETEKYQAMWQKIADKAGPLSKPQLFIPDKDKRAAREFIAAVGLRSGEFVFCFPAGIANVVFKKWPEENFATVIAHLEKKYSLKTLIAGHEKEKYIVDNVAKLARQRGASPVVWLGKDGDVPLACALVAKSSFYFGNDTGLMHMAAALGKPVIAIFGGGTWPRFLPNTNVGRAFIKSLPCFYCRWNCIFNEPFCINFVSADAVKNEIKAILDEINRETGVSKVVECTLDQERLYKIFEKTIEFFLLRRNEFEKERQLRFEQINKLTGMLKESEADRAARLEQVKELTANLKESEADRAARFDQITELTRLLKESETDRAARLEVIHRLEEKLSQAQIQIIAEKQNVADLEQGWRDLEETFAVRQARRVGLIKARKFASREFKNED